MPRGPKLKRRRRAILESTVEVGLWRVATRRTEALKWGQFLNSQEYYMSHPAHPDPHAAPGSAPVAAEVDVVESIAHAAPIVLPIVGGVLMFLLAFIAVFMA